MSDKDDKVLATAKERHKYAVDRRAHNVLRQKEDMRFAAASPDDPWQWDSLIATERKAANRPMLTINKLPLHIRQVTNDIRQNRPQIRFRPADDKADVEVADILNGLVRHIEAHSQADMAYDACVMNQVTMGEGYIRVLADYISEESFDQDIFFRRVDDPFRVFLDPDRLDWTGSDAKWCVIEDDISEDEFKEQYPDADPIDWTFSQDGCWFREGDGKRVLIAEYFEVVEEEKKLYLWANGSTSFEGDDMPQGVYMGEVPIKDRKSCKKKVIWRKINGQQVLEEKEFPSKYIPVVCAVGNSWKVDGKTYLSGLVRNTKDSQRFFNIAQTAIAERVLLSPKAPWVAPAEAINGYEKEWQQANTKPHSFLPYNHLDAEGAPIPPPQRTQPASVEPGLSQIAMSASDDIKAETGQFDASLGQKSNETSGKAILARQREGDTATFHYVDNFAQAVRQLGVITLDMIPRVLDTRRVAKILGEDGEMATAVLDPKSPEAIQEFQEDTGAIGRIFNPNVGFYDVYTSTGPSYTTRRVEAAEAMTQLVQASPDLWSVIGDQIVKSMDWPGAEEMSDRLKLTLNPAVQKMLDQKEGGEKLPPQVQAAMEQQGKALQAAQTALQNAAKQVDELQAKVDSKEDENLIKAYDAQTKRLQVMGTTLTPEAVQAVATQTVVGLLGQPEPLAPPEQPAAVPMMEPPPMPAMAQPTDEPPQGGFSLPGQ